LRHSLRLVASSKLQQRFLWTLSLFLSLSLSLFLSLSLSLSLIRSLFLPAVPIVAFVKAEQIGQPINVVSARAGCGRKRKRKKARVSVHNFRSALCATTTNTTRCACACCLLSSLARYMLHILRTDHLRQIMIFFAAKTV
jgi:hypothetical protein